jgi:hypothetical protein
VAAFAVAPLGTIYACMNNSSGTVKIVTQSTTCKNNETKLEWNTRGPAGPQGETGATGPMGPQGPVATPGTRATAGSIAASGASQPPPSVHTATNTGPGVYLVQFPAGTFLPPSGGPAFPICTVTPIHPSPVQVISMIPAPIQPNGASAFQVIFSQNTPFNFTCVQVNY